MKKLSVIKPVVAFIFVAIFLFPIYWMTISSFKSVSEIFQAVPTFFPRDFTFEGYIMQLFTNTTHSIAYNFRNSIIISVTVTIVSVSLSALSAYGLARYKLKLTKILLLLFLITQMLPNSLFLSPLFVIFKNLNILDNLLAPVILVCLQAIPFCVLTLRPYFLNLPSDLEDSAVIDGCNRFTAFLRIIVPITYPGLVVSGAFSFLWGWGNLVAPLTFLRTATLYPLTVNMYKAIGEYGVQWNSLMAFAVILTTPVVLMFIFLQKYLVAGLTSGAVKG